MMFVTHRPMDREELEKAALIPENQYIIDKSERVVHSLRMLLAMVKEADLNKVDVPRGCEPLDATALGKRLGLKRDTVLAYLSRGNFKSIPRPNRLLKMGPVWFEQAVAEWEEANGADRKRGG